MNSVLALVAKKDHNHKLTTVRSQIIVFCLPSIQLGSRGAKNDPGVQEYEDMLSSLKNLKNLTESHTVLPRYFTERRVSNTANADSR